MGLFEKIIVLEQMNRILDNMIEYLPADLKKMTYDSEKRDKISKAVFSLKKAIDITDKHIKENGYVKNTIVTESWHEAFGLFNDANIKEGLEDFIYRKVQFWDNPETNVQEIKKHQLVPKLVDLRIRADKVLNLLK